MIEWMFSPRPWTSVHKLTNCSSAGAGCDGGGEGWGSMQMEPLHGRQPNSMGGGDAEREREREKLL